MNSTNTIQCISDSTPRPIHRPRGRPPKPKNVDGKPRRVRGAYNIPTVPTPSQRFPSWKLHVAVASAFAGIVDSHGYAQLMIFFMVENQTPIKGRLRGRFYFLARVQYNQLSGEFVDSPSYRRLLASAPKAVSEIKAILRLRYPPTMLGPDTTHGQYPKVLNPYASSVHPSVSPPIVEETEEEDSDTW